MNDILKLYQKFTEKHKWITSPYFLSILYFIVFFLTRWYTDEIISLISILIIPLFFCIFIIHNFTLYQIIKRIINNYKKIENYIPIIILITGTIISIIIPSRETKMMYELKIYKQKRIEIIEKIKANKLKPYYQNNVKLPLGYKKISSSGEVYVYKNDKKGTIIGFWIMRGLSTGPSSSIIFSDTKEIENYIPSITYKRKINKNWYYIKES